MEATKITVSARLAADVQKAWDYYHKPEHIVNWNFASPDWHCPSAENDLRAGGTYRARMEARDGSMGFDFEAVWDRVDAPRACSYTMADGRQASIQFEPRGSETLVTISFDAENQNDTAMQQQGWQAILDQYKAYTEASKTQG